MTVTIFQIAAVDNYLNLLSGCSDVYTSDSGDRIFARYQSGIRSMLDTYIA